MLKKVLVVDDEPSCCEMLREFLAERGYHPVVANSGAEALVAYEQERPDVVLLDVLMPDKDGLETLRELKAMDPEAGVVMVTAVQEKQLALEAMTEGAFDYITKPIDCRYLDLVLKTKMVHISARPQMVSS